MAKTQSVAESDVFGGAEAAEQDAVTVSKTELSAMIAQAVAAALAAQPAPAPMSGGVADYANALKAMGDQMALSISELTHQTNRTHKPVDPKILAARAAGQARLDALIEKIKLARKDVLDKAWPSEGEKQRALKDVTPRYRLISTVVFNDELIAPVVKNPATKESEPVSIYWAEEPNDATVPLNDIAKEVQAAFVESRGARSKFEKAAVRPVWTTDSGRVIEGRAPSRRQIDNMPGVMRDALAGDARADPALDGKDVSYTQVLGTKHRPFESVARPMGAKVGDAA